MQTNSENLAGARLGILILAMITALIHLSLNFVQGSLDVMFTLNGLGYLVLLAALFLNLPLARENRRWVRLGFIGFTVVTIIAWVLLGDKGGWLGWLDKIVEVALIALLLRLRP